MNNNDYGKMQFSRKLGMLIISIGLLLSGLNTFAMSGTVEKQNSQKVKNRLETLFLWKVSDKLELSVEKEKKFLNMLNKLKDRKIKAKSEMDEAMKSMSLSKVNKEITAATKKYESAMKQYYKVHLEEISSLRKIVGDEKLAQYLVLKEKLAKKIKLLLSPKSSTEFRRLATPKIIEE